MLYFNRIDVPEGIDVNKASTSKECIICHCWYFLDKWFGFQSGVCNGCQNVLMMSMNLNDITTLNIHDVHFCCIINRISESEAMSLLINVNPNEKSGTL